MSQDASRETCWIVYAQKKIRFFSLSLRNSRDPELRKDIEQEIEFSNHENNWFKSERTFWRRCAYEESFRLFLQKIVLRENSTVLRKSRDEAMFGGWCWNYAYLTIVFCFFVPVKGNREGNSQFDVKESFFSLNNHRDWSIRKMRKPLKKLNKRNFAEESVKRQRFRSDWWNSVIPDR